MDVDQIKALHQKYAPSIKVFNSVFSHCQIVWGIAEQLIMQNKLQLDNDLVKSGCLLHDIGAYKFIDTNGVYDEANYIRHGIEGYKILKDESFSEELRRITERHTGVGITAEQIQEQNLPLPPKDYIAETTEEKLVMYADKFHSKDPHFNSFEFYRDYARRFSQENVAKFEELAQLFGKPDLKILVNKYGQQIV